MVKFIERGLAPCYLLVCLILGGASAAGYVANGAIQLIGLGLISLVLATYPLPLLSGRARMVLAMIGLFATLQLIQLIPLPPAVWSALPERGGIREGFDALGLPLPWLPVSVAPDQTITAMLSLIPAFTMVVLIYVSSGYGRLFSVYALIATAIGSILLGILQKFQGPDSAYYFYEFTNRGGLVGFFANRNHLATLLLTSLPFLAALAVSPSRKTDSQTKVGRRMLTSCAALFVTVGIIAVKSVAGWMLLLPVLAASFVVYRRGELGRFRAGPLMSVGVLALIAVVLAVFAPIQLNDLGDKLSGVGPHERSESISLTLRAAGDYIPFGSGGGSFSAVYPQYEDSVRASSEYVSHAHSDYAELFMEYGVGGIILIGLVLLLWLTSIPSVWGSNSDVGTFGRAGFVAVGVVLAHSAVDYPARTAAVTAVLAMAAALMAAPVAAEVPRGQYRVRRKRMKSQRTIWLTDDPI